MSIQSEITRISNNVQNTINTIADTGVAVPTNANSDNLPALAAALANEKAAVDHTHEEYAKNYNKVISRGEQLVVNGSGLMGNNTNFSGWVFDGAVTNNTPGSFTVASGVKKTVMTDEYFPVNPNSKYLFSFDCKSAKGLATLYSMIVFYDVDKNEIKAPNHLHNPASTTTLAQDLKKGDTVVYLTSTAGWSTTFSYGFYLNLWNYTNSFGYTYPAGTYTRNRITLPKTSSNKLDSACLNTTANTITLASAYTGATIPAGTPVSQGGDGGTYKYFPLSSKVIPASWQTYSGTIEGVDLSGGNVANKFPPATAYAKIGFLWNYNTSADQIWLTNAVVTDISTTNTTYTLSKNGDKLYLTDNKGNADIIQITPSDIGAVTTNTTYSLSKAGSTITLTGSDGSTTSVADTDTNTNTTYSLTKSGDTITLTGSDGSTSSVTDSNTFPSIVLRGTEYGAELPLLFSHSDINNTNAGVSGSTLGRCNTVYMNPKTSTITASTFKGALNGNADTATKATQDGNGNNIANTYAKKRAGIYYVEGDTGGAAGVWTGSSDDISEYYDGLTITYRIGTAGATGTTLNINGLGAKPCYRYGTTTLTTHHAVGTVILLIYSTAQNAWYMSDYDANSYAYVRQYYTTTNANYPLLFKYDSGLDSTTSYVTKYTRNSNNIYANPSTGTITAAKFAGVLIGNADTATKATQDASGNVITEHYATKAELANLPTGSTTDCLPLAGGTMNQKATIKWTAMNSKNPYIGYCSASTDGTFMVGSIAGTSYTTGLAIGGSSGNLLWKGAKIATVNDGVASATKATQDGNGNNIASTYVTKANLITEVLAGLPQAEGVGF